MNNLRKSKSVGGSNSARYGLDTAGHVASQAAQSSQYAFDTVGKAGQYGLDTAGHVASHAAQSAFNTVGKAGQYGLSTVGQLASQATQSSQSAFDTVRQAGQYGLSSIQNPLYPVYSSNRQTSNPLDDIYTSGKYMIYYNVYKNILTSMFNPVPNPNMDKNLRRAWPAVDGAIQMKDFVKPLDRSYKENKIPKYLLECQPIGGFKSDTDYLMSGEGNPSKIFERFAEIASENIVAVSEAGINTVKIYDSLLIDTLKKRFSSITLQ